MNKFKKFYCRAYQFIFKMFMPFLNFREPKELFENSGVVEALKRNHAKNVFLVTDETLRKIGLTKKLEDDILDSNISVTIFDKVLPNPTISLIEDGVKQYKQNRCDAILAFGGGSVIDAAKVIGARVVKPNQSVQGMKGLIKIGKKLPLLIAVPTTAGTGSETTVAAIITDEKTHHKYAINDPHLIPAYALFDANLIVGLNPFITATTGMDALTHAVEAYIGRATTKQTRKASLEAVRLIKENLEETYKNGSNLKARQNMLYASYLAGAAFTRSYVGYVHAIAHSLGGEYNVAHGFANAVILPVMLKEYGQTAQKPLAELARYAKIAKEKDSDEDASNKFIEYIEYLNKTFNIPTTIKELKEEDIPLLAKHANAEANPLYPVPKLMDTKELEEIYKKLLEK